MSAVGYASIPVTLSFANAAKAVQSQLKPQLDKLSKDAAAGIDKNVGSAAEQAAAKVKRAREREEKATKAVIRAKQDEERQSEKVVKAKNAEEAAERNLARAREDASGKAAAAEEKLNKVRNDSQATTQQIAEAEREYQRALQDIDANIVKKTDALADARGRVMVETRKLEDAETNASRAQQKAEEASERVTAALKQQDEHQQLATRSGRDLAGMMDSMRDAAGRAAGKIGDFAQKHQVQAGIIAGGIGALGKNMADYASEAEQSYGAVESIFAGHADQIVAKSQEAAHQVGLSGREYRELASTTGAMLKNMGMPMDEVSGQTQDLVTLGADLAATFGGPTKDAMEAIGSLLRGEANPIERYGVSIKKADVNARMAADGLDKLEGEALKQAEAQTMLALLMEQTADAQGQFARETDTAAHKQQVATAAIDDAREKIGTLLLPIMAEAMEKAAQVAGVIAEHPQLFAAIAAAIGGLAGSVVVIAQVTKAVEGLSVAFKILGPALTGPWGPLIAALTAVVGALTWFFTKTETGQRLWAQFTEFFQTAFQSASDAVVGAVSWLIEKWNEAQQVWEVASAAMRAAADWLRDKFHEVITSIVLKFIEWQNNVNQVIGVIKAYFQGFADKVRGTAGQTIEHMREIPRKIKSMFSNAGSWLVNAGKNMVQGLINGIKSMTGRIGDAFSAIMPNNLGGLIPGFSMGGLPGFARGGVLPDIPGISRNERDPILGYSRERKMPIARIEPGEFVVNRDATARHLPLLQAINGGDFQGAGDLPGYANGGVISAIKKVVFAKYPNWGKISDFRPGDPGNHGAGLAVDFSNGTGNTAQQLALAKDIARVYPESAELIYDAPGWSGNIKNGKNVGAFGQFYTMAQAGPHHHHVHWAMKTPPTKPLDGPASGGGGSQPAMSNLPPMKWSEAMLTQNAVRAGRAVAVQFPEVQTIGGYRANDPYPDHPSGRALDIMTYTNQALGDKILNYLFDNNGFFKMQYAIWKQAMWYKKGAPQPMADRGSPTQNHMDHVHAYFEASPRANGSEIYPNSIGAGGANPALAMGDANLPLEISDGAPAESKGLKQITSKNVDYGTAAQLASKWESDTHRDAALREYLGRKARVYDTGGILPTGGVAVNLGKPELIFPAEATTAMLQMARQTPQFAAAMETLSASAPQLAAAVDKFTDLDYGAVAEEITAAWRNEDFGYGELARAVGEEAAERIVTEIAFIGDQIRDMQDGSNMRAYLANMSASEAVGLADQVGQLAGISGINSTFGGVAKGYEALQDAAVMQVDAADAVAQAEENLTDVRRQYAEMLAEAGGDPEASVKTQRKIEDAERKLREAKEAPKSKSDKDGSAKAKKIADAERQLARVREDAAAELEKNGVKNADELVKASEAVTAAEQEREKALGTVKMAAQATGQAQIAMALQVAEMVVGIGKKIWDVVVKITDWINNIRIQTRTAVWELTKSWSELTGVVDQHRGMVAQLQMQLVNAALDVIGKSMEMRTAQVDVVRAQLQGAKNVAEAEGALQAERDKVMGKQKWNFRDMSLEYDRFRQGYRDGINEQIAGMAQLSVQERDRIMATIGGVGRLSEEERARLVDAVSGMSDLSAEERERIVAAINGNGELTAADRARLSAAIAGMTDLSAADRERMQSALTGIGSVTARERDRILSAMDGLVSLTAEERARLSASVAGMSELSERERARVMVSLNGVGQLTEEERDRVRQAVGSFDDLTAGERERINAALAGVGELTVEERARVANAIAGMSGLSEEERERIIRAINGVSEVAQEERLRVVAALTGIGSIHGKQQDLTNQIVANVDKEGLAVKLGLDAKLAAQKAADDAYIASVNGREVGERELHQMYKLQLAEQLVGEQAFQDLKDASLDAQLEWQRRVDKAAQLGLKHELEARAAVTPEILALQREVYAAEFAQQKSILDAQIKGIEATFAQQKALVAMGRLQEDLVRQRAELDRLSGQTMGMNQGQAIVMEEIARLQKENAEILGKRNSAAAGARNFFGRMFDWDGDGNGGTNTWSVERKQYDAQIAANNRQIAELQKSVYAEGAFTPAQQREIDKATKLAAKYFAQGNEAAAKAALQASPLGNAQRSLEVNKTLSRITDWESRQRDLQREQQDMLAEFKKNTRIMPLQWRSQELESRESAQRYAADALRSDNDGVRDALATLSRLEESNAAELKQLREKPTVVNVTVPGPRDGVTTIGEMEDALVALAGELGVTRTDVKRLNEARRTSASDRVRAAIGR